MLEVLQATKREAVGSHACKRLRREGQVPAVMYGHGEATIHLALQAGEVEAAIRHGAKVVEIAGAVKESALLRDVQWDALGSEVLHVDLTRVSAEETVEVELPVELRGEAPGTKEGGVVTNPMHSLAISCPAAAIPEKIEININELQLGDAITAGDIVLPENAELVTDADAIVAQCIEVGVAEEEEAAIPGAAEPEVIGRKAEDEEAPSA